MIEDNFYTSESRLYMVLITHRFKNKIDGFIVLSHPKTKLSSGIMNHVKPQEIEAPN